MITFHPYIKSNKDDFYNLNISWLKELFLLEPYDEFVLSNPKSAILDKGGYVFMGKLKGKIVATFALNPAKMVFTNLTRWQFMNHLEGKVLVMK